MHNEVHGVPPAAAAVAQQGGEACLRLWLGEQQLSWKAAVARGFNQLGVSCCAVWDVMLHESSVSWHETYALAF